MTMASTPLLALSGAAALVIFADKASARQRRAQTEDDKNKRVECRKLWIANTPVMYKMHVETLQKY